MVRKIKETNEIGELKKFQESNEFKKAQTGKKFERLPITNDYIFIYTK
ncbi:unknown [Clostridium sp. CAG:575]|nr:unknown [Clostridium sp. CAG:575]